MPQLLQLLCFGYQNLHTLLVQFFLGGYKFRVGFQFLIEFMQFFNNFFVVLLGLVYFLLIFFVELGNLGIDELHFLYFSLDIQVFVLFCFDGQLQVVDEFFVLGEIELQFRAILHQISPLAYITANILSSALFWLAYSSCRDFRAYPWAACWFLSMSSLACSHYACLSC